MEYTITIVNEKLGELVGGAGGKVREEGGATGGREGARSHEIL